MTTRNELEQEKNLQNTKAIAMAGFSIIESLMLSLKERGFLDEAEFRGLLTDAAEAHKLKSKKGCSNSDLHRRIGLLVEEFRDDGNSTRAGVWLD